MAFLFGRGRKGTTQELVRATKELMTKLVAEDTLVAKVHLPIRHKPCMTDADSPSRISRATSRP